MSNFSQSLREKTTWTSINGEDKIRHQISRDSVSILEEDIVDNSVEDTAFANVTLQSIIRDLDGMATKFVCMAIWAGFQSNEIAWMMKLHPSTVTRIHQRIQLLMSDKYQNTNTYDQKQALLDFIKLILPEGGSAITKTK